MDETPILVEKREGFRVITLNRPARLNAFTEDMHVALKAALDDVEGDSTCRALADHRRRPRFLRRPGSERPARQARREDRARRHAGALLQPAGAPLARAALPGRRRGQRRRRRRRRQCRARLRHRARRESPRPSCRPSRKSGWFRIPAAPGSCRGLSERRARAALSLLAEPLSAEKAEAMGPDLESGRRQRIDGRSDQALRRNSRPARLMDCR